MDMAVALGRLPRGPSFELGGTEPDADGVEAAGDWDARDLGATGWKAEPEP